MSARGKGRGTTLFGVLVQLLPSVALATLFVAVGVMHVTSRVLIVNVGYRLSKLEAEGRELDRKIGQLRLEAATLKAPARLERLAREELSMGVPAPAAVLSVGRSATERRPRP